MISCLYFAGPTRWQSRPTTEQARPTTRHAGLGQAGPTTWHACKRKNFFSERVVKVRIVCPRILIILVLWPDLEIP